MSTRYMRKVYGNDLVPKDNNEETSDNDLPITGKKSKHFNVFDLLNENSESEGKDENGTSVDDPEPNDETEKRKKKRKKKKKSEKSKLQESKRDESQDDEEIDEVERSVREVNRLLGEPLPSSSKKTEETATMKSKESILSVQHKFLNPHNELKRICGSKVLPADPNKSRSRGRSHLRKTWLTSQNDWIPVGKSGLSMSMDQKTPAEKNLQYFVFVHSRSYQQVQEKFYAAVMSQKPENIIAILNAHPYHIDALLQFADMCKLNEELQMSAEFCERAVHYLECAFHPLFNITNGNCRMNYKYQTNRALFIALFRHLMFIGGRACYRTSLELCKVLLSLDPIEDPTAIVLAIDLYALRAREYEWFIEFCEFWDGQRNLTQLPNIAYSLALAHFHLGNDEVADQLLENALFMFPGVLVNLLDKCGISTDTRVLGHDYFNSGAKKTTSAALEKLQDLYVIRTFHLWKEADILPWLERNVNKVMDKIDTGESSDQSSICKLKRSKRYQGKPPRNILRHIILSDLKEISITHPGYQTEEAYLSYDPLPPADSIDVYENLETSGRNSHQSSNSNLLSLFISTLFSDFDAQLVMNGEEDEQEPPEEFD